jgi:L-lactate dehydrogenase
MMGMSFALMQRSLATEIVLVDLDHERAAGEAIARNHGVPLVRPIAIRAGAYRNIALPLRW